MGSGVLSETTHSAANSPRTHKQPSGGVGRHGGQQLTRPCGKEAQDTQERGVALTGMDPDTALLAGNQETGAVLLQVRGGKVDVRAASRGGEAHFWNQWLGPLLLQGCIRCTHTVLSKASKLHLQRTRQAHGTVSTACVQSSPSCLSANSLTARTLPTAPGCTAIIPSY